MSDNGKLRVGQARAAAAAAAVRDGEEEDLKKDAADADAGDGTGVGEPSRVVLSIKKEHALTLDMFEKCVQK